MRAIMESLFDVFYLCFAFGCGTLILQRSRKKKLGQMMGWMCLVLGAGDAFHLVPRVASYWMSGVFTAALGIGTMVTSITMTVFYLMLEYARRERFAVSGERGTLALMWLLAAARIALCLFPQNRWTAADAPLSWGIYRNIPFVVMGALTVFVWFRSAEGDRYFRRMWLSVLLSFLFYLPVVLFADAVPMVGMLMLPKTVMYMWMMVMFRRACTE